MSKKLVIFWIVIIIITISLIVYSKNKNEQNQAGDIAPSTSQTKGPVDLSKTVVVEENHSEKFTDGGMLNTSSKLKEEKTFNGLKFTNISLSKQNGNTILIADVENNSGKDLGIGEKVILVFKNSEGNEVGQMESILPAIKNREKGQLNSNVLTASDDIVNAYDFEIKVAK